MKKNIDQLKKIYENMDEDTKIFAHKLIEELDFMEGDLDELKAQIKKEGATIVGKNTKGFDVIQEHPAQKSYNTMIKNYNSTIRQLCSLLPESNAGVDELEKWRDEQ